MSLQVFHIETKLHKAIKRISSKEHIVHSILEVKNNISYLHNDLLAIRFPNTNFLEEGFYVFSDKKWLRLDEKFLAEENYKPLSEKWSLLSGWVSDCKEEQVFSYEPFSNHTKVGVNKKGEVSLISASLPQSKKNIDGHFQTEAISFIDFFFSFTNAPKIKKANSSNEEEAFAFVLQENVENFRMLYAAKGAFEILIMPAIVEG